MKYVVYFDTPIPRSGQSVRTYLQQAGSLGYDHDNGFPWEIWNETLGRPECRLCGLGSRVLELDTPKQAKELAERFAEAYTRYKNVYTVGYHGLTENGNACTPFVTVVRGDINVSEDILERHKHYMAIHKGFADMFLPNLVTRGFPTEGRDSEFTREELFQQIGFILDNLVEEELDQVLGTINSMENMGFVVTDIDLGNYEATIHLTRPAVKDREVYHTCITIVAMNLMTDEDIAALGTVEERARACGVEYA